MTEELAKYGHEGGIAVTQQTIKDFLFTSKTKLSETQQAMFVQLAIRHQLDPFKREIYAIAYGADFNIVTGYQTYIQRAEATGKLDGWECVAQQDSSNKLRGAKITIYRKDFSHPFVWEVSFAEFDKGQSLWKKMPEFLIKKVCIGQGFRLAFPNELSGMPYLAEEMEGLSPSSGNGKPPISQPTEHPPVYPSDASLVEGKIENITVKTGGEGKHAWSKYTITLVGGDKFSTFDKKIAEDAKAVKDTDVVVNMIYKTTNYGNEIVEFTINEED